MPFDLSVASQVSPAGRLEVAGIAHGRHRAPERRSRIDAAIRAAEELHAIPYMTDPPATTVTDDGDPRSAMEQVGNSARALCPSKTFSEDTSR